jgi:hypothetical protein
MPECVGNYSIPTVNSNVEGADTLVGAGILNFRYIYVQQTPVNAPYYSFDNSRFWCQVSSVLHKKIPTQTVNLQASHILADVIGIVLSCPERDQLQNRIDNALAELGNWLKANKHTKLNHMYCKQ